MNLPGMVVTQARVMPLPAADLLTLAKSRAPDGAIFEAHPPFFWQSEISSDRLDAYYTVMDADTTLVNYAADAAAGVAVLVGHDTRSMPVGYSLTGEREVAGDAVRVISTAYALEDEATRPLINRIKAGIIRDESVGFSTNGAQCLCNICGLDMWRDWDCWHIPGFEYETTSPGGAGNGQKQMVLATGRIVNARLSEYSLVYDGATPGAAVLQAIRCAEAGKIDPRQARMIEQRYRMRLPEQRIQVPTGTTPLPQEQRMELDVARITRAIERTSAPADDALEARIEWMAGELVRLAPLASDGTTYRESVVNGAVAEAVRAMGAEKGEAKRATLERLPIADVLDLTAVWRGAADAVLTGGRKSAEGTEPPAETWAPRPVVLPGASRA